ncbi:Ig domain protein group 2 domain protein [Clostridium sp. DL-VIII]|uniref:Ig-like domain-containing protein n=1 Tax=Clostridium sp. DL-VIII TaxID=641107 RepID=UPI00023B056C|nr:Ig-like domain-containing protein [Clostridium sp. DL-VIII]EHJ01974.1 Ig domain protein group 2 domain protein [Clostridium sp. DL-VIII]
MNFLSKKARLDLVAKTLIVTSILGSGSYIILNDTTVTAYATTTSSNKELVKAKILNDLLAYKTDITFSTDEYTSYSIGTDSTADPQQAYFEVLYEHPEIFWTSQSVLGVTNTDGSGNKTYTLYVNNLYSDSDITAKKAELDSKINDIVSKFTSYDDLRKVYEIHDYVNANVTYDHALATATPPASSIDPHTDLSGYIADTRQITQNNANYYEVHSLYGAVVNGDAVCEGYAKFANTLLTKSGIEANIIVSASHAWNYVNVNGNYYQLDTTWDDQSDDKTLTPYKYFNITNNEMLEDTTANKTLHNATSYVPNCTDTTFDNIFRTVGSNNIIQGKNVMRVDDKLYYLDDSGTIYSYNLDGTNQAIIRSPKSGDLIIYNLMEYDGSLYYLSYKTDANYTYLMEINKIDLSANTDTPVLNINDGFGLTNGSLPNISFYIDNNNFVVTSDGTTKKFPISIIKASGITISGTNSINVKGGTTQLTATVTPNNTTDKTVTWSSSDENIATVDANGLVTAKADGAVVITVKTNDGSNVQNTYNVSISGQTDVKTTGITIDGTDTITAQNGTTQLTATVNPSDATDKTVTWSSSDNTIATVDSNGLVTAKSDGSVDITATANDGSGISSTKTISVSGQTVVTPPTDVKVTGISISGNDTISTKDGTTQLTATVNPSNATDKTVTWTSSDNTIATVDSNGLVTAKADGSVDIKATANDGSNISSTKTISVSGQTVVTPPTDVKVTEITISGGSSISTKGETLTLTTDINPSDATDKSATWTSSDDTIATVDNNGVVTAKADGSVDITATANDGSNISSTKTITVSGQSVVTPPTDVKVTGITISGGSGISTKGGTTQLIANVSPSNATDKTVTWSSSDNSIATVDSNGLVTAKANGTVIIKVKANDGSGIESTKTINISGQTTTIPVTNVNVTGITISGSDNISTKGGTLNLTCNVAPSNATNKTVTWTSSDNTIATVDANGLVTAKGNGSVTITATANDGSNINSIKTITISGQITNTDSVLKSVSISGTEEVGHTLKSKISYDGAKPSVEYQWQRASTKYGDYSDISGATDDTYKLKSSDKNKYIRLVVTTNINGSTYTVEDTTGKIDTASSSDNSSSDTTTSSSDSNSSTTSNTNDTVVLRPSTSNNTYGNMGPIIPTNESPSGASIVSSSNNISNVNSLAYGRFTNPAGHPVSGWLNSNESWYYLDNDGYVKTGWIQDNGKWYYLNTATDTTRGTMKTGWLQDTDGKWYYLNSDGSMAINIIVDGYTLGNDGAWIG